MQEDIKFRRADLREYLLTGFPLGKDFGTKWDGPINHPTEKDSQGYPTLHPAFAEYMDQNQYGLHVSYQDMVALYDSMARMEVKTHADERMAYLHATWTWWSFWRQKGMTQEAFAERKGVNVKTVGRWLTALMHHIEREVTAPNRSNLILFPTTYAVAEAQSQA